MKKFLLGAVKVFTVASFFVPLLVFSQSFIFPFVVPKVIAFRMLAIALLALYGVLFFVNKEQFRPRFSWLNTAVLVYALGLLISTFAGVDWYNSFWDSHERMLGTFTFLHGVAYYLVLSQCFQRKEDWKSLLWWFLGAGMLSLLVGVWQRIDPQFLLNNGSWRVIGTLGNPIYVGGYGLFVAYLGYLLRLQEVQVWKRWLASFCSLIGIVLVFFSGTRGTMVAFFLSVGLMMLLYTLFFQGQRKVRLVSGSLLGLGFVMLLLLVVFRQSTIVQNMPSVGRLVGSSISAELSGPRVIAWKIAAHSFWDHPFFGWGPNNFYYAFNQYYNPHIMFFGVGETWFDNAHNVIMNTIATGGVFGIVAYLGLFAAAIYQLSLAFKKKEIDIHLFVVGICFLAGHFIHNIFVFENATSVIYFFFFLAFIQAQTSLVNGKALVYKQKDVPVHFAVKYGIVILALIFMYRTDINVARANMTTLQALRVLSQGDGSAGIELYTKAKSYNSPHIADIRNDFIRSSSQIIDGIYKNKKGDENSKQFFDLIYAEQKANHELRPMDIRTHISQIHLDLLGNFIDPTAAYLSDADVLITDALRRSPKRQQLFFMAANLKLTEGKPEEALLLARSAVEQDVTVAQNWIQLAALYARVGQTDAIPKIFEEAKNKNVLFSPQQKNVVRGNFGVQSFASGTP